METFIIKALIADQGQRLDKMLASHLPQLSRARIQNLIEDNHVFCSEAAVKTLARKVKAGEIYTLHLPPPVEAVPQAQFIPLNIIYEDQYLLVINKPSGLVVHPAAGNYEGTLVNALLAHCGESLSGIGGVKRPGIVHRLDKDTSGLMVVAKNDMAHQGLSAQLANRSLKRVYQALVWGHVSPKESRIITQIGRSKTNRQKMAVLKTGGKEAITDYKTLENFGTMASLLECRLQTGRTHQIRVHMAHIRHSLIGDQLYGNKIAGRLSFSSSLTETLSAFPRQALHAVQLEFIHPIHENRICLQAPLPEDFALLLHCLRKNEHTSLFP